MTEQFTHHLVLSGEGHRMIVRGNIDKSLQFVTLVEFNLSEVPFKVSQMEIIPVVETDDDLPF